VDDFSFTKALESFSQIGFQVERKSYETKYHYLNHDLVYTNLAGILVLALLCQAAQAQASRPKKHIEGAARVFLLDNQIEILILWMASHWPWKRDLLVDHRFHTVTIRVLRLFSQSLSAYSVSLLKVRRILALTGQPIFSHDPPVREASHQYRQILGH